MKRIYKYKLDTQTTELAMPARAEILKANEQHNSICIWAEVDDSQFKTENRVFKIFATGGILPEDRKLKYIDTVLQDNGYLVWHIYEDVTDDALRKCL